MIVFYGSFTFVGQPLLHYPFVPLYTGNGK